MKDKYPYRVVPLPYPYNDLEPYIDTETMKLHHDKHYQSYVDNLNNTLKDYPSLQEQYLTGLLKDPSLIPLVINNYYDEKNQKIVKVDVGGYRKRRENNIERMAVEFGKQVARTKQEIKLDNLNSYERKIIHDKLSSWKDVKTFSVGEEPDRYLIIQPK